MYFAFDIKYSVTSLQHPVPSSEPKVHHRILDFSMSTKLITYGKTATAEVIYGVNYLKVNPGEDECLNRLCNTTYKI